MREWRKPLERSLSLIGYGWSSVDSRKTRPIAGATLGTRTDQHTQAAGGSLQLHADKIRLL